MDLDPNSWYRLTIAGKPQQSLSGTYPYMNENAGLVTIAASDLSTPSQQWQFIPLGSSVYLLRTKASGVHGYFAVRNQNGTCEGSTPVIYSRLNTDESMLWAIRPKGSGVVLLSTNAHDYSCTLDFTVDGAVVLRSSSTRIRSGTGQTLAFTKLGKIDDKALSVFAIPPTTRVQVKSVYPTLGLSGSAGTVSQSPTPSSILTWIATSYTHAPSTISSSSPLNPQTEGHEFPLSPSAAMGVGVGVGIGTIAILLSIILLIHHYWKLRSSPSLRHYRQAKQWKGFTPATPTTARTTFVETKMANIYFAELPTPATPVLILSPPLEEDFGNRVSWFQRDTGNRASWPSFASGPVSPIAPGSPPVELPV